MKQRWSIKRGQDFLARVETANAGDEPHVTHWEGRVRPTDKPAPEGSWVFNPAPFVVTKGSWRLCRSDGAEWDLPVGSENLTHDGMMVATHELYPLEDGSERICFSQRDLDVTWQREVLTFKKGQILELPKYLLRRVLFVALGSCKHSKLGQIDRLTFVNITPRNAIKLTCLEDAMIVVFTEKDDEKTP